MDSNLNMKNNIIKNNNWISGKECIPVNDNWIEKYNPHTGEVHSLYADSGKEDIDAAIESAASAFSIWSEYTPVKRGQMLGDITFLMKSNRNELADCIAKETGKTLKDAIGEVNAAILQGEFFAGEGMRLYSKTLTSGMPGKSTYTIRQPLGIAGLIVPANTPIANIAWKTFPALICGNTVVLKASEDAPSVAFFFAQLTKLAGIPDGVFNVVQGRGKFAGSLLVEDPRIAVISFTGSTSVGRMIAEVACKRLARVSLELGGKNPFVVCDDADLDQAVHWAVLSAFSNAGQRCAAGSRILVFRSVFEKFKEKLINKVKDLKLGVDEGSDLGPVINKRQQINILDEIQAAKNDGGKILCGGSSPISNSLSNGYYIIPTVIDNLSRNAELSTKEIFGPVASLHIVENIQDALEFANSSEYGLTSAIHTRNIDRAIWFAQRAKAGVVNINIGTFGSEAHMPFGGFGASGNGTREPGVEALDVYSELKCISILVNKSNI
jgi:acyl-CoA reductase-like NAD-dependent aldehyde dehydrogenase